MLQTQGLKTLDDLRAFLAGSQGVEIRTCEREACYAFVGQTLNCFGYRRLGKAEKGLVRAYLGKVTGLSRAQLTRLVRRAQAGEALRDRRGPPAMPFARRYTPADVRLLAEVDALHGNLSGPATRKLCERAWEVFGDARYERLAGISNGHLYNLRGSQTYQRCRGRVDKTRAVQVRIGERRRPRPEGRPGFLRVDSVHQGDLDGVKGLYHINLVDEVTQFQFVGSIERISEHFLLPVLAALLEAFPFVILGFHSDNGSEYINARVAALLAKLHAEFTKSRSRRTNDNALAESKNGSVIRLSPWLQPHPGSLCPASQRLRPRGPVSLPQFPPSLLLPHRGDRRQGPAAQALPLRHHDHPLREAQVTARGRPVPQARHHLRGP